MGWILHLRFIIAIWAHLYNICEIPNVQAGFRKGRGTRDQIANQRSNCQIIGSLKKQESSRKTSISALRTMPKALTVFSSIQFSRSVMSNSLRPYESQHAMPPCPSPTPRVYSNSCPSSQWCHPASPSSVIPFSSCPQSLPASGSFPMSQHFAWGGQSIGVSALASVLPMNTQDWSALGWTGWISLQSKGLLTPQFKSINSSALSFLHSPTLTSIHDYWKNHSLD